MKNSGSSRIAERYVRALFEVAQESSVLAQVEKDMAAIGTALEKSEDFRQFLTNPLVPRDHQADVMLSLLDKMKADAVTRQFVAMLARQKRLNILPVVLAQFARRASEARGELTAELVSATALKARDVSAIAERLGKAYGKKMNLEVREDASLLGGIIVKIGSQQLDSSLAGKLNRLRQILRAA